MTTDLIKTKFDQIKAEQRTGIILFLTAGYPDLEATRELIPALVDAGADAIELGIPFSDPLADGATIQSSSFHALNQGTTLRGCLDLVRDIRPLVPNTPLILMGYYNPIFTLGLQVFSEAAEKAGVDGLIVPDLPVEEAQPLLDQCRPRGIHLIPLLAPTSTEDRIRKACSQASGFIYCVTITGVTGARETLTPDIDHLVARVRSHTPLPVAVGFGISKREHIELVGQFADGAIIGSALIKAIQDATRPELVKRAVEFVHNIRQHDIVLSKESC